MELRSKLIFDLDGTLIDVRERHFRAYKAGLDAVGGQPLPVEKYWEMKRQRSNWQEIIKPLAADPDQIESFLRVFRYHIETPELLRLDRPYEGVSEKLKALSESFDLLLVTSRFESKHLINQLEDLGWTSLFNSVRPTAGFRKSDVLKQAQLDRNTIAYWIGDTEEDYTSARDIGAPICLVTSGSRDAAYLQRLEPDALVSSVVEFVPPLRCFSAKDSEA